jgi:hypothetical protein
VPLVVQDFIGSIVKLHHHLSLGNKFDKKKASLSAGLKVMCQLLLKVEPQRELRNPRSTRLLI